MKELENLDWSAYKISLSRKARPYDTWLDGSIYLLEAGVDYHCTPESLTAAVRHQAKKRGISVRCAVTDKGVIVQAFDTTKEK